MIVSGRVFNPMFGVALVAMAVTGCSRRAPADAHADHEMTPSASNTGGTQVLSIPAGASTVAERLAKSPRHGEYVMIRTGPSDSVKAWVVYPQRSTKAPVVVVVHEIFGLSTWVRGVADQLAADGFIAIAPDFSSTWSLPSAAYSASIAVLSARTSAVPATCITSC